MSDCIFCGIVAGRIPCTKVCDDGEVLAFMDIGPVVKGHVLVIPKDHYESIADIPEALLAKVIAVAKRVAAAQLKGLGADGVNIHQSTGAVAGQVVPHIHFHVIPRFADDGHSWNWSAKSYSSSDESTALAAAIEGAMAS